MVFYSAFSELAAAVPFHFYYTELSVYFSIFTFRVPQKKLFETTLVSKKKDVNYYLS